MLLFSTFLLASGPGTPDSIEGVSQHLSPESSRKAYCRTWEQPSQSASFTHMPQSPNVFNEHMTNSTMSPGTAAQSLKSPASIRSRSVSDSSVPRRGNTALFIISSPPMPLRIKILISYSQISALTAGRYSLAGFYGTGAAGKAKQQTHQRIASRRDSSMTSIFENG